ncbi:hypothetical protein BWI17_19300 [Betaproteobacteria bacterium GR16-43]|nr:hypothetical protein BWI17_19300 [Betaproteobacteria bacterium GR16-43]
MNATSIYAQLHREGLVADAQPPAGSVDIPSPWYVRVMLGTAGWIAGLLLMGFFGGIFVALFRDSTALIGLGLLQCGAAAFIYRMGKKNEVLDQVALGISMSGQAMVGFGLARAMNYKMDAAIAIAVFQAVLVIVMSNYLHRLISTIFAGIAISVALWNNKAYGVASILMAVPLGVLWLRESDWRATAYGEAISAVAWGLSIVVLFTPLPGHLGDFIRLSAMGIPEAAGFAVALVVFATFACRDASPLARGVAFVGAVVLSALAWRAPGVIACGFLLLAGYRSGSKLLLGLAAVGLLSYLSAFYYQLSITLLAKSQSLAAMGAVMLVAGLVLHFMNRGKRP